MNRRTSAHGAVVILALALTPVLAAADAVRKDIQQCPGSGTCSIRLDPTTGQYSGTLWELTTCARELAAQCVALDCEARVNAPGGWVNISYPFSTIPLATQNIGNEHFLQVDCSPQNEWQAIPRRPGDPQGGAKTCPWIKLIGYADSTRPESLNTLEKECVSHPECQFAYVYVQNLPDGFPTPPSSANEVEELFGEAYEAALKLFEELVSGHNEENTNLPYTIAACLKKKNQVGYVPGTTGEHAALLTHQVAALCASAEGPADCRLSMTRELCSSMEAPELCQVAVLEGLSGGTVLPFPRACESEYGTPGDPETVALCDQRCAEAPEHPSCARQPVELFNEEAGEWVALFPSPESPYSGTYSFTSSLTGNSSEGAFELDFVPGRITFTTQAWDGSWVGVEAGYTVDRATGAMHLGGFRGLLSLPDGQGSTGWSESTLKVFRWGEGNMLLDEAEERRTLRFDPSGMAEVTVSTSFQTGELGEVASLPLPLVSGFGMFGSESSSAIEYSATPNEEGGGTVIIALEESDAARLVNGTFQGAYVPASSGASVPAPMSYDGTPGHFSPSMCRYAPLN